MIHATLVVLLVILGSRAAGLTRETQAPSRVPLSELEIIAPAPTPDPAPDDEDRSATSEQTPSTPAPSVLDRSAKALIAPTPVTSQAMSAATLDELARQSNSLSSEPTQAPAPISFAGVSTGAARSIVYVIDTSGATMTSLSYIRERLLQSIDRLSPTQRFQVIAFRKLGESSYTTPDLQHSRNQLPRATRANKQAVADWIEKMPAQGRSNPVDGLEAALALKPDMILLISRGIQRTEAPWAGGLKHVRERLDELNPLDPISGTRPVVIKTIQLLDEDPTGIMRTIGVFHGDGHNDHQVITYNQLSKPEILPTTAPTTSMDSKLSSAEDQLASLKATGALYRATTSIPTSTDRSMIDDALIRIDAMLSDADPQDPRTALLQAETQLLRPGAASSLTLQPLIETLNSAVFVSPDLDARRRIVLAQLNARVGNTQSAIDELGLLLDERAQLKLADLTIGRAVLALSAIAEVPSDLTDRPPFTTDPAWALMLAQTQTLAHLHAHDVNPLSPLLDLRTLLPTHTTQIDDAIARVIDHAHLDTVTLPSIARFIDARSHLSVGPEDDRLDAINTLLTLSEDADQQLARESLWLACLGARALNTRRAGIALMSGASKLADRFPDHPGAPDALAGAIDTAEQSESPNLTPLLRQAIALYPDRIEIDLWKLRLINLVQGPEQTMLIESLTPATRESDLGAEIYHQNALDEHPVDPLAHASSTALVLDRLRSPLAGYWHRIAAELELSSDPVSAATRLARLVGPTPSSEDPELELLYARALLNAQKPDLALSRLTELTNELNTKHDKHFWHAWTLIIETIVEQGNTTDKDSARSHLARLTLIDPKLGPEPFRSRLIKASNTLHSQP